MFLYTVIMMQAKTGKVLKSTDHSVNVVRHVTTHQLCVYLHEKLSIILALALGFNLDMASVYLGSQIVFSLAWQKCLFWHF